MLQADVCRKALEARLKVFQDVSSVEEETAFFNRCCGIVWFLEEMGVFEADEALDWAERFCDASAKAWLRLFTKEESNDVG